MYTSAIRMKPSRGACHLKISLKEQQIYIGFSFNPPIHTSPPGRQVLATTMLTRGTAC